MESQIPIQTASESALQCNLQWYGPVQLPFLWPSYFPVLQQTKPSVTESVHVVPAAPPTSTQCLNAEHQSKRKGLCRACGLCRYCPMVTPECATHHIGEVNPTKRSMKRKRERRRSGGTPSRDVARNALIQKFDQIQAFLAGETGSPPNLGTQKIPLTSLHNKVASVLEQMVHLVQGVSDEGDVINGERQTLMRIVGDLKVSSRSDTTIRESDGVITAISTLVEKGSATTQRFMLAPLCSTLTFDRYREISSTLSSSGAPVGRFAFSSRRADYTRIVTGQELEPKLGYVRLSKHDIMSALTFIQHNCDLSWRNGHTVTRTIGETRIELPRLKRHLTMRFLFSEYKRWCATQSVGIIGRHEFNGLLRLITLEVKEVTGASYYYTDGVIDTFKMVGEMLERLKTFNYDDMADELEELEVQARNMHHFVKYDLRSHLDAAFEGTREGFHCARHAVNGECGHTHQWTCKPCSALDRFSGNMIEVLQVLVELDEVNGDELRSMIMCMQRIRGQLFRFVKHVARGIWQHARIAELIVSVSRDPATQSTVLFVDLDHKQKVIGRKLVENQIEYFGKSGMSLLGAMVMQPSTSSDNSATTLLHFMDMVVSGGSQDLFQVISCLEGLIPIVHNMFPTVTNIVLISDNASVFVGGDWIPWVVKLARRYPYLRVTRYLNTEAQTGRDMLDAHFSYLNRKIDAFVRKNNAVQTPGQLYDALVDGGGVANTTTLQVQIDVEKASWFNSYKRTFNSRIQSGVRRVHDIIYEDACAVSSPGATPLCRIYTNTGVPNSVMMSKLKKSTSSRTSMPKYICPVTLAEQILASVVDKVLREAPHSDPPLEGTLTGVQVQRQHSSRRDNPLCRSIEQVLAASEPTAVADEETSCTSGATILRCAKCAKRYTTKSGREVHESACNSTVIRDKNQLIASVLTEFFTASKQAFVETRAQMFEEDAEPATPSCLRLFRNWAEKESTNEFGMLPQHLKDSIKAFVDEQRGKGAKAKPEDVVIRLFSSIVSPTDWDAKYLLSEQRLKAEISRLCK